MKNLSLTFLLIIAMGGLSFSQTLMQTVKGKVYDKVTNKPLPFSTVVVLNSDPVKGTIADKNGNFILEDVTIGRRNIQVSMVGYVTFIVNELMVSTGKDIYLDIAMQQKITDLKEVVVRVRKDIPINTMTTLSSRQFTVEETQRYAGGMDDPARLASSFAGVATPSVSSNGISVRGNNPHGLLWRIEGVEVSNPNHFADLTVVGGGLLTALSNHTMGNSDFYTGAFPAEYGNATSGVFDINLKKGNSSRREFTFKAGLVGIDFAAEGPLIKEKEASYIMNYRYSTMALVSPILPDDAGILKYQDITFKTNFPTLRAGTFSFWGLGAIDGQKMDAEDISDWESNSDRDNSKTSLYMFASGLSHKIRLNSNAFLKTIVSVSGNGLSHKEQRLDFNLEPHPYSEVNNDTWRYILKSSINFHFSSNHINRTGFCFSRIGYNINIEESIKDGTPPVVTAQKKGQSDLFQFYTQSKINILPKVNLNMGVNAQYFLLNNNISIEPRVGIKYNINNKHSLAFAYGLHSRIESLAVYFVDKKGNKPNKKLKLMKASHFVLAYDVKLNDHLHMCIEPYCQYLRNIPVSPTSYISTINIEEDIFFNDILVSKGTGRNIGIDFSLEQFIYNHFYYLFTASVFDSKYTGTDGIERNTRFNKNYVFNALFGKEWVVGKNKNNILSANLRINYIGGNRKEPIDIESSISNKDIIYAEIDGELAYEHKIEDMPIFSITISYRKNKRKYSSVWSLQILNASSTKEYVGDYYNLKTGNVDANYQGIIVPNLSYKIEF